MDSWSTFQQATPCYVINMDRCPHRLDSSIKNIVAAGFSDITRFAAIDAINDDLNKAWAVHGYPRLSDDESFNTHIGEQGCALSHLSLWKSIIQNQLPLCVVFEDDVCFHTNWNTLAKQYWDETPKDFDILYLGSQILSESNDCIVQTPLYCTHAYVITLEGAQKLYNHAIHHPRGLYTIDCILYDAMKSDDKLFVWYAWNASMHPDPRRGVNAHWVIRNSGLVFQDETAGTFVKPR